MVRKEREASVWIATGDEVLCARVSGELQDSGLAVRRVDPAQLGEATFWRACKAWPGALVLDVAEPYDLAVAALRGIKKARVPAPVIAIADSFSHEFGTRIVSEGVGYCLLRDFANQELRQVVLSLMNPRSSRMAPAAPAPQNQN